MNDKIHKALLEDGPCLSQEELRDYHDGKLGQEDQHKVETHLLHCDLCSEALEGMAASGLSAEAFSADVEEINTRAWKRVEALSHKKPNRRPVIWMSAASLLLIGISVSWFWYNSVAEDRQMEAVFSEQFSLPKADSALLASARLNTDSLELQEHNALASGDIVSGMDEHEVAQPNTQGGMKGTTAADPVMAPPVVNFLSENGPVDDVKDAEDEASDYTVVNSAPPYPAYNGSGVAVTESKEEAASPDADLERITVRSDGNFRDKTNPSKAKTDPGKDADADRQELSKNRKLDESYADDNAGGYKQPASPSISYAPPSEMGNAAGSGSFAVVADSVSASVEMPAPDLLLKGLGAYNAQDYRSAVEQFNELLKQDPQHQEANFYAGVSYLGMNDAQKAIPCLERARTGSNPSLSEDAEWYLSLAYLKSKNKSKAEPLLKSIESRSAGRYRERAADVLEDLRKP